MTTTTKESAAFKTWTKRLDSLAKGQPWKLSQINAFRLAYVLSYGGKVYQPTTMTLEEAEKLVTRFEAMGTDLPLTDEHAAKGRNYLKANARKLRSGGFPIDYVLSTFDHFTWSGFTFYDGPYINTGNFTGQWRIHLNDGQGSVIAYSVAPWQSGGVNTLEWRYVR